MQHQGKELLGPSAQFWLGTDELGRDLFSRIIYGARPSLVVALMVMVIGGGLGIVSGLTAGYVGGWVNAVIMRMFDALFAFPAICWASSSSPPSGLASTRLPWPSPSR